MAGNGARFEGKVALVTGAARGIGRAIALRLAEDGADVVAAGLHLDGVEKVAEEVRGLGRGALAIEVDVTSLAALEAMARKVEDECKRADILVPNAGLIRPNPFGKVTEEDWDISFDVNAKGLFFTMQTVAPLIPDGGTIINISSVAGRGAPTASPPYGASKAAVINLTQGAARALAGRKIRVNAVCPGYVQTDFQVGLDKQLGQETLGLESGELRKRWMSGNLLGSYSQPEDVAAAVAFLAGPEGANINAQAIHIDGGLIIF
jgi:meso-butanediol dehydrogenase/(S,S)-butanediol dehydrogenase/diacetyl reductase